MNDGTHILTQMSDRSREVFRRVVEAYLSSGGPVGSRTLTRQMSESISAATIRNVMQDLEYLGVLDSPHVSAGRVPTQLGLRMFVDGLLEVGEVSSVDREKIDATLNANERDVGAMLDRVGSALSGLTHGASLVLAPKHEAPIRHIEFVSLAPDRAMVVLVFADGHVENRLFLPPPGLTPSSMQREITARRRELDTLAAALVESGVAIWENEGEPYERLIVRGRANLLEETPEEADLDRIRLLFDDLERKRDIVDFLELAEEAEGVRIFIGSENKLFSLSGSSLVVSPYMNADRKVT